MLILRILSVGLFAALSGGCADHRKCDPIPAERLSRVPTFLSETGLFSPADMETPAAGVYAFTPRFPLWTDGAEKRRWVFLPPGSKIDTSDPDFWRYPEGTRLWKEFTRDGVRIETRLLEKVGSGDGDWIAVAYLWQDDQKDAVIAAEGAQDAKGTAHDVPEAADCMGCHGGEPDGVLGFTALQLSAPASSGEIDLAWLTQADLLSRPPVQPISLPGDEKTQAALGYLHANCGHCHNADRPESSGSRCYDPENEYDFLLRLGELEAVEATAVYRTTVGTAIQPGAPDQSYIITLMSSRGRRLGYEEGMPPLGTELVDETGLNTVKAWISAFQ